MENIEDPDQQFPSCSIASSSAAFVNFVREYAATNDVKKLIEKEKAFFLTLKARRITTWSGSIGNSLKVQARHQLYVTSSNMRS
jgi:hypothetical protein